MVVFNWQIFDFGMQLNQVMFVGGIDQLGYVLKLLEGCQIQFMFNLIVDECVGKWLCKRVFFDIDVILVQQLMRLFNFGEKWMLDFYVEVEVFFVDDKRNKNNVVFNVIVEELKCIYCFKFVCDNGFNFEFNMLCLFDFIIKYLDLIFVRFKVKQVEFKGYNDKFFFLVIYIVKFFNFK